VLRTETVLGGFFLAAWVAAGVYVAGWLEPPGLALSFYGLFSFAAAFGWVIGNLLVLRLRALGWPTGKRRRSLVTLYLAAPAGLVALLRAMAPTDLRRAAPIAGLLALVVYAIFFVVPVSLRRKT
jgi:cytochrome b